MTGSPVEKVVLQLNTSAKSLLLEEFPLAEKDLKREDGKWILRTVIHSLGGAGRFVIGLAADVKILKGDAPTEVHPRVPEKVHSEAAASGRSRTLSQYHNVTK